MTTPQPLLWKKLEGKKYGLRLPRDMQEIFGDTHQVVKVEDVQTAVNECVEDVEKEMIGSGMCPCDKKCIKHGIPHARVCPIYVMRKHFGNPNKVCKCGYSGTDFLYRCVGRSG